MRTMLVMGILLLGFMSLVPGAAAECGMNPCMCADADDPVGGVYVSPSGCVAFVAYSAGEEGDILMWQVNCAIDTVQGQTCPPPP